MKQTVEEFLAALALSDSDKYAIVTAIREKVQNKSSEVKERMMYGGIMFSIHDDLGGIFVYTKHISFEFGQGFSFNDPENLLEGNGKFRRHLKIKSTEDKSFVHLEYFIQQMIGM